MKLSYNVTGPRRKSLVAAISQELNAPTKYLGMPTAAYEVGGYHIDKAGTVTGPDNLGLEDALHQLGFDADGETREYDESDTYESGLGGLGALDDPADPAADTDRNDPSAYADQDTPPTAEMPERADACPDSPPEFEDLQMTEREGSGLGEERRDTIDEDEAQPSDVPGLDSLTIEMPLDGFTPEKLDNLAKLVNAKASLLKAALGAADLPIKQTEDTLQFPWFGSAVDNEHTEAYSTLVSLLCKTAIEKQRVTAKEKDVPDNPKYAMRCFLLSIGMIGAEHKSARKILLSKLEGNSSWKNGKKADTEVTGDE